MASVIKVLLGACVESAPHGKLQNKTPKIQPNYPMRNLLSAFGALVLALAILTLADPASAQDGTVRNTALDRITYAVDGAESSHGNNASMWRANPRGPQGPMQVSEKAAIDVGGGDRFDIAQNRALGRAYLALLYRRYENWADAISAYNWGMGNLDSWIKGGRQSQELVPAVALYLHRVLRDSGVCGGSATALADECRLQMTLDYNSFRLKGQPSPIFSAQSDKLLLSGMEQSGRPIPVLAGSGRALLLAQSNRERSGRPLPRLGRSLVCSSLGEASTKPRAPGTLNPYSIFAPACR